MNSGFVSSHRSKRQSGGKQPKTIASVSLCLDPDVVNYEAGYSVQLGTNPPDLSARPSENSDFENRLPRRLSKHRSMQSSHFSTMSNHASEVISKSDDLDIASQVEKIYARLEKTKTKLKNDMEYCPCYWKVPALQDPLKLDMTGLGFRPQVYQFLVDSQYSTWSKCYYYFVLLLVSISILSLAIEDTKWFRGPTNDSFPHSRWEIVEMLITISFTVEWMFLMFAVRNRVKFALTIRNVADFLAIMPFYIDIILVEGLGETQDWIKLIRLLRIARLARIRQTSNPYVIIIGRTLIGLKSVIVGILAYLSIGSLIIGTIANVLEPETFYSVPLGAWYGLVTLTTVGYGDIYPATEEGKMVGSVVVILGLVLCSIVLQSVGQLYNEQVDRLKDDYHEIKQCLLEKGVLILRHGDDLAFAPLVEFDEMVAECIKSDYCYPQIGVLCRKITAERGRRNARGNLEGANSGGTLPDIDNV